MNKDVFRKLRQMLMEELDLSRELSDKEILDVIDELILNQIKDVRLALKEKVQLRQELFYSVRKLDVLQELVDDETVTEIMVNKGRAVSDFGARRAHNMDAAVYGARAAYIGGAVGTATVLAGQMFNIPISGTMAHSWVMFYRDEFEAFKHYAENYPDATVLLVDTYDVVKNICARTQ